MLAAAWWRYRAEMRTDPREAVVTAMALSMLSEALEAEECAAIESAEAEIALGILSLARASVSA